MPYVGLGGSSDVLSRYGSTTARGLLARMQRLPREQRTGALKAVMSEIDTTLQSRTESYAAAARRAGVPTDQALETGLARALSEGVVSELAQLGKRGTVGQSSLLGLGLDSARARALSGNYIGLGDNLPPAATFTQQAQQNTADKWAAVKGKTVAVGPFTFPADTRERFAVPYSAAAVAKFSQAQRTIIRDALIHGAGNDGPWHPAIWPPTSDTCKPPCIVFPYRCKWLKALGLPCDKKLAREMLWQYDPRGRWREIDYDKIADEQVAPILTFKHPVTGNDWGLFMIQPSGADTFYLYWRWIPEAGWLKKLGRFITHLPANIVKAEFAVGGAIKEAAEWIGGQTCNLVCNPNAAAAAGAANPAAGAGALIAGKACKCGGVPQQPPPQQSSSNTLLYVLLAGGGLLAAIALTQGD